MHVADGNLAVLADLQAVARKLWASRADLEALAGGCRFSKNPLTSQSQLWENSNARVKVVARAHHRSRKIQKDLGQHWHSMRHGTLGLSVRPRLLVCLVLYCSVHLVVSSWHVERWWHDNVARGSLQWPRGNFQQHAARIMRQLTQFFLSVIVHGGVQFPDQSPFISQTDPWCSRGQAIPCVFPICLCSTLFLWWRVTLGCSDCPSNSLSRDVPACL